MANGEKDENKYDSWKDYDSSHTTDKYGDLSKNLADEMKKIPPPKNQEQKGDY